MQPNIHIDEAKYFLLKSAYASAVKAGKESFLFDGHTLVTNYAKYMLEFLELKGFGRKP